MFDLAVDADDNFWFLECNAEGQWSPEDELIEGEISRAFAKDIYRFGKDLGGADNSGRRK